MKPKVDKELWLFNTSQADVSVSDLGVKVPAGKSINVYRTNPYLTEAKVEESKSSGSLAKRLAGDSPVLKIVKKAVSDGKEALNKLQVSDKPLTATRTKNSVVIDSPVTENAGEDQGFDFADYGVDAEIAKPVVDGKGVVVTAKTDEVPKTVSSPAQQIGLENKTVVVGVARDPVKSYEVLPEPKTMVARSDDETRPAKIVMDKPQVPDTKPVAIDKKTVVVEQVPDPTDKGKTDLDFLDSIPTKTESGIRVATRTKGGITVMKVKE
jgi:hypothetical protein